MRIMTYSIYEIVKIPFPFTDANSTKIRPALIISSAEHFNAKIGMSVMVMITSFKPEKTLWPTDHIIEDIENAGLNIPSIVRFKAFTLDHRLILGHVGKLSELDQKHVRRKLKDVFSL